MRLSVIVPVYNVEKFLSRCIDSLYRQELSEDDFEVIVVNDGSLDNSLQVAKRYESTHKNLHVVSRENGGLSAARNTGLEHAIGDYVWFVDSDDWIETNVLREMLKLCQSNKLDILCFGLKLCYEDGTFSKYVIGDNSNGSVLKGEDFVVRVGMPPAAWCALYNREFLLRNNLWFFEGILHEDQEFTPRAYVLAGRIMFYDRIVYNYFQRSGSIMKALNYKRKADSLLIVSDSLYDFSQKHSFNRRATKWIYSRIYFAFCQSLSNAVQTDANVSIYKKKEYYPLKLSVGKNSAEKLKFFIINQSPMIFKLLYKLK